MTPEKLTLQQGDTAVLSAATNERNVIAVLRSRYCDTRLLLVEDNPVDRGVARDLVLAAGLKVDMAENGRQAVEKTALVHYDLILMDVLMPMMNGLEATRAIRLQPGGVGIPVLAMTANAFDEARPACLEAGMQDFIAKPVNPVAFYSTLLQWLSAAEQHVASDVALEPVDSRDGQLLLLAGVSGLDLDSGLANLRGDVTKYTTALDLFADECYWYVEKLSGALAREDIPLIEQLADNASMLGAQKVAAAAENIISTSRSGNEMEMNRSCSTLIDELLLLIDGIRCVFPHCAVSANSGIDQEELADMLTQFEIFLERGNINANRLAREKAGLLQTAFGQRAKVFLDRIESFDYDNAVVELRHFRIKLKGAG